MHLSAIGECQSFSLRERYLWKRRELSLGPATGAHRRRSEWRQPGLHRILHGSHTCMTVTKDSVGPSPSYIAPFLAVWITAQSLGCSPLANLAGSETSIPPRSVICDWLIGSPPMFGRPSSKIPATPDAAPASRPALKPDQHPPPFNSSQDTPHTFTMASRPVARASRQIARQLAAPVQKRTFVSALNAARAGVAAAPKAAVTTSFQQARGIKTIDFAGTKETVYGEFLRR